MALCTEDSHAWEEQCVCVSHSFTHAAVVVGKSGQPLEGLLEHYATCCFPLVLLREGLMSVAL